MTYNRNQILHSDLPPAFYRALYLLADSISSQGAGLKDLALLGLPFSISLPPNLSLGETVPLAAFLLDYPIAYVPQISSNSHSTPIFLADVVVNTYECTLVPLKDNLPDRNIQHDMLVMKFSCPQALEETPGSHQGLSREQIVHSMRHFLEKRIKEAPLVGDYCFEVRVTVESVRMDRLAL